LQSKIRSIASTKILLHQPIVYVSTEKSAGSYHKKFKFQNKPKKEMTQHGWACFRWKITIYCMLWEGR